MFEDLMPFDLPQEHTSIIKVLGVGGGGSNAVNHMFRQGIKDVSFVVCNTDAQALTNSPVPIKIQLGATLTEGRGAGNKPEQGRQAAIESLADINKILSKDTKMAFITAGMGGGTGTGAAPIIAKASKELGILTVGIVTLPFRFEGSRRIEQAIEGIKALTEWVDSLLVINNEKLREITGDLPISQAFGMADDVLTVAAKGIAEIITVHGHINVDFADVQTVMTDSGVALMGSATASGPDRAITAIQNALNSPLLDNNDIKGARNILLNIVSGKKEATMDEINTINDYVQRSAGYTADLIWGNTKDDTFEDKIGVTVIATGFETDVIPEIFSAKKKVKEVVKLEPKKTPSENKDGKHIFSLSDITDFSNDVESMPEIETMAFKFEAEPEIKMEVKTEMKLETKTDAKAEVISNLEPELPLNVKADERLNTYRTSLNRNKDMRNPPDVFAKDIETLENEPAYLRRGNPVDLKKHSSQTSNISKYSLTSENDVTKIKDNSFLHDRVD